MQRQAKQAYLTGSWFYQRQQHADGRAFTGSVGPQETKDIAFEYGKVQAVHSPDATVTLAEFPDFYEFHAVQSPAI